MPDILFGEDAATQRRRLLNDTTGKVDEAMKRFQRDIEAAEHRNRELDSLLREARVDLVLQNRKLEDLQTKTQLASIRADEEKKALLDTIEKARIEKNDLETKFSEAQQNREYLRGAIILNLRSENREFKAKLETAEKRIELDQCEAVKLRKQNVVLSDTVVALKDKNQSFAKKLEAAAKDKESAECEAYIEQVKLQDNLDKLEVELQALKKMYHNDVRSNIEAELETKGLEKKLAVITADLGASASLVSEITTEKQKLKDDLDASLQEREKLKMQFDLLTEMYHNYVRSVKETKDEPVRFTISSTEFNLPFFDGSGNNSAITAEAEVTGFLATLSRHFYSRQQELGSANRQGWVTHAMIQLRGKASIWADKKFPITQENSEADWDFFCESMREEFIPRTISLPVLTGDRKSVV